MAISIEATIPSAILIVLGVLLSLIQNGLGIWLIVSGIGLEILSIFFG